MLYDIAIIGGGASGLCTAIMSKTDTNSIVIIEHNDRVGKKILSTGNGRCNLTNEYCKVSLFNNNPEGITPYHSNSDINTIKEIIEQFDYSDTLSFFKSLGLLTLNKNGYIYPRSEQASSVLDIFRIYCEKKDIVIKTQFQTKSIKKEGSVFNIDNTIFCKKLVLSTGGMSQNKTGSDGSGYHFAKAFGHHIIKPLPSLCGLICLEKSIKELAGVRCEAKITLFDETNSNILSSFGNIQFTDKGISGIPVFQISSYAGRLLEQNKKLSLSIDFLPDFDFQELLKVIDGKEDNIFLGILNKKIGLLLEKVAGIKRNNSIENKKEIIYKAKNFVIHPIATFSYSDSQVTSGGVSLKEIYSENMMSKKVDNLFFTGEILDADGICGGYNLQWAWSTAYVASKSLK